MADLAPSLNYLSEALERIGNTDGVLVGPTATIDGPQLALALRAAADDLHALGCRNGDRVAILTECPGSAFGAALAAAHVGAIPAILHRGWFTRDIDTALASLAPTMILTDKRMSKRIPEAKPVVFDTFSEAGTMLGEIFPASADRHPTAQPAHRSSDSPSNGLIVFSSGTTGTSTAFHHTDDALRSAADIARNDAESVSSALVTTDPSSSATLITILELLAAGVRVEVRPRWTVNVLDESLTSAVNLVVATAHRVHGFLAKAPVRERHGAAGRRLLSTGGPLMADLTSLADAGLAATACSRFELAEVAGWVAERTLGDAEQQQVSAAETTNDVLALGSPLAGVALDIGAEDGTVGSLLVSGQRTARHWVRAGLLHPLAEPSPPTGDLVVRDSNNNIRWMGRASDCFTCDGSEVYPVVQETAIAQHRGIADVAIVARPDVVHGSIGVAVTVPIDPSDPPFLADLLPHLGAVTHSSRPRAQWITAALPLTPDGRIQRRLLGYEEMTRGSQPVD